MAGTYVLTRIDGQELPAGVPLPAAYGSCTPQVIYGDLSVTPRVNRTYPLYSILIAAWPQVPPSACKDRWGGETHADLVRDAGRWTGDQSGLRFESQLGAGTYDVRVGANGAPTLSATVAGHTLEFQRATTDSDEPVGIAVGVFDQSGARVSRSVVAVSRRNLTVYRGLEFGYGFAWAVARGAPLTFTVTPAPGYTVAPGNAASITVTPGPDQQAVSVRFVLARTP